MIFGRRPGVEVIELIGPDTRRFANGMFTNNVRDLPLGAHQFSCLTDDRGRMLGLLDVLMLAEDRLFVVLEGISAADFEERYGMFIVFDDVELRQPGGSVFTFQGAELPDLEGLLHWPAPRSKEGGVDIWVEGLEPPSRFADLPLADEVALEALRVEVGWPRFPLDASAKQLPHELNLRDTHLHFEKGCYRGQETIHRVDVMGQVKKTFVGVSLEGEAEVGSTLEADGKRVGRLGSVVEHPTLGQIGLAVVRTSHRAVGTVLFAGDTRMTIRSLP